MRLGTGLGLGLSRSLGIAVAVENLDSVVASTCCDLDATIPDSYGGSGQTWANLTASPADGAGQTDYDFFLGIDGSTSTDDPTFNGSAGDSAAYFSDDGGDAFGAVDYTNQSAFRGAHRTDVSGVWFAMAFRAPSSLPSFGTLYSSGMWQNADVGFSMFLRSDGKIELWQSDGNSSSKNTLAAAGSVEVNTDYLLVVSWDGTATTDAARVWLNTTTKSTADLAFNTITTDSIEGLTAIGASADDGTFKGIMGADTRFYSFALGNALIDDADASAIFDMLEIRHNRDYTP